MILNNRHLGNAKHQPEQQAGVEECTTHIVGREAIPQEMRDRHQWITWNSIDGKKIPNGRSNTPGDWKAFTDVEIFDNIAFVISPDDPYTGIDLDGVIVDGQWVDWVIPILEKFSGIAYGEISPSGTGLKLTTRAAKPAGARCVQKMGEGKQQIECYDANRFWTITGDVQPDFRTIGDGQVAVDWLCNTYLSGQPRETGSVRLEPSNTKTPESLLNRAKAYVDKVDSVGEGGRNNSAFNLAGHLHAMVGDDGTRLADSDVFDLLSRWNRNNTPPLPEGELSKVVLSARKNGTPPADKTPKSVDPKIRFTGVDITGIVGDTASNESQGQAQEQASESDGCDPNAVPELNLRLWSAFDLINSHPEKRIPVIEGLLRRGEVCNVIAPPKTGKSWLVINGVLKVATGGNWLGHQCTMGKVLVIDNELHEEELADRYRRVASAMGIKDEVLRDRVTLLPLRGIGCSINDIQSLVGRHSETLKGYSVIVLDALYRFLPSKVSENDNAAMMQVYNAVDGIAKALDAAVVIIHHTSKGNQSNKDVTDVGAGAGSVSRAADSHLTIRQHEIDGSFVVEAVTRSWSQPEAKTCVFDFPLWRATEIEPVLKQATPKREAKQRQDDEEADRILADLFTKTEKWLSASQVERLSGMGPSRVKRAIGRATQSDAILSKCVRRHGRKVEVFKSNATANATAENDVSWHMPRDT